MGGESIGLLRMKPRALLGRHLPFIWPEPALKADSGHRALFRQCLLFGDEPPFLPGSSRPLEPLFSLFPIYFSDRASWAMSGRDQTGYEMADAG
jgi:hypothetical protein